MHSQLPSGARVLPNPMLLEVLADDLLLSGEWQLDLEWHWRAHSHINILSLESHAYLAYLAVLNKLLVEEGDLRFTTLLDSQVAK